MKRLILSFCFLLLAGLTAPAQEAMTPGRFREIAATPGDPVPLVPQLAPVPFWTNAVASNVMTYASGQVYQEEMAVTARTVGGRYVVFTAQSKLYKQPVSSILAYDEKAAALKVYGLYGDGHGGEIVTEGTAVYDFTNRTYTINSAYGDGYKEVTTGFDNSTEDLSNTRVYKDGSLFVTRKTITRPVVSP